MLQESPSFPGPCPRVPARCTRLVQAPYAGKWHFAAKARWVRARRGAELEPGEVLSSAAAHTESGKSPLCIDSRE